MSDSAVAIIIGAVFMGVLGLMLIITRDEPKVSEATIEVLNKQIVDLKIENWRLRNPAIEEEVICIKTIRDGNAHLSCPDLLHFRKINYPD